jgi:hypothetical protein
MFNNDNFNWEKRNFQIFWGEIAPCDHVLQIYDTDLIFLDSLEGFVGSGILANESVIVIGTSQHLTALEFRLKKQGFDLESLKSEDVYIPLNAEETLAKFIVNGWPDEDRFLATVKAILNRAKASGRKVRAFGEMVAILWAQGNNGATVRLEYLWNSFCETEDFCLFCAYPKAGFTQDANESLMEICKSHSKVIAGWASPSNEITYKGI